MIMARSTSSTSVNSNSNQNKQQNSDSSSSSVLSSGDIARATVSPKVHCGALYYFPFWHPTKKVLMKVRSSHNLFVLLPSSSSSSETLLTILTFTKYTHTVPKIVADSIDIENRRDTCSDLLRSTVDTAYCRYLPGFDLCFGMVLACFFFCTAGWCGFGNQYSH